MYRLAIGDGAWDQVAKVDGLTVNLDGLEGFPSTTVDGRVAIMRDTSVVQIYEARWTTEAELH
jgi:hypothetical protein